MPIVLVIVWLMLVFIPYLSQVPTVYISIITAVISVVAGVSLRPFLEKLFSGVVITFLKSIKVGDTVILDNHYGLIEEVGLHILYLRDGIGIVLLFQTHSYYKKKFKV